eukprot:TRINITY_DN7335_c0_g1_i12.p1 TRINITY_DN7335_c0_g1~~TRINITY_DN7335_c0_g1_i12.p1  ORF type:complete len:124 (+),score=4.81 TRINITY_DN7335_c0_g1_i12:83-454(+)
MLNPIRFCRLSSSTLSFIQRRHFQHQVVLRQLRKRDTHEYRPIGLKAKILWQFWRPMKRRDGSIHFWNMQYNVLLWTMILLLINKAILKDVAEMEVNEDADDPLVKLGKKIWRGGQIFSGRTT